MTRDLEDIRRLLPVLDMTFQAEQLKMAGIMTRIDRLKSQIDDIENAQSTGGGFDPATRAGADVLWQGWAQDRKKRINRELALAMRDREAARSGMQRTLAKVEAARMVEARALLNLQRLKARRS